MNQRAIAFEISTIAILMLLGTYLSSVNIDNTGVWSVAGILAAFCLTSHYKLALGFAADLNKKAALLPIFSSSKSE